MEKETRKEVGIVFARRLSEEVAIRGWRQTELGMLVKVRPATVNNWLSGVIPNGLHLVRLCKLLEVRPEYLLGFEEERQPVQVILGEILKHLNRLIAREEGGKALWQLAVAVRDLCKVEAVSIYLRHEEDSELLKLVEHVGYTKRLTTRPLYRWGEGTTGGVAKRGIREVAGSQQEVINLRNRTSLDVGCSSVAILPIWRLENGTKDKVVGIIKIENSLIEDPEARFPEVELDALEEACSVLVTVFLLRTGNP